MVFLMTPSIRDDKQLVFVSAQSVVLLKSCGVTEDIHDGSKCFDSRMLPSILSCTLQPVSAQIKHKAEQLQVAELQLQKIKLWQEI